MAVTVLTAATSAQANPPANPYTALTHTCTAGLDRLLLVHLGWGDNGVRHPDNPPTYGGQAMTEIGTGADEGVFVGSMWFYLNEAGIAAAVSATISVDTDVPPGDSPEQLGIMAVCLAGVDQVTPIDTGAAIKTSTGIGTTASVTVDSAVGDMVFAGLMSDDGTAASVTPNQTQIYEQAGIGGDTTSAAQRADGASSVTLSWTTASERYAVVGFNVNAASGGGGGGGTPMRFNLPRLRPNAFAPSGGGF